MRCAPSVCRRYAEGKEAEGADAAEDAGKATVIAGTEGLGEALATAEAMIVCCDVKTGPITTKFADAIFNSAPNLKHCALLSSMGGGKGGGLFAKSLAPAEAALGAAAARSGCPVSIVRAGVLKGGGPGNLLAKPEDREAYGLADDVPDFGLSQHFYDNLFELQEAMATMAHDKFGLGAAVVQGDPYTLPNPIQLAMTANDFDPRDIDTSRVSAAAALLAAVQREDAGEFTVSVAAAKASPTNDEWLALLDAAASA